MAKKDTKQYSLNELEDMNKQGDYVPTRADAPAVDSDEEFWRQAEEAIERGLAGVRAGRVVGHEDAMREIRQIIAKAAKTPRSR